MNIETQICAPLADPAAVITRLLAEIEYAAELRRSCKSADEANARESNLHDMLRDLSYFAQRSTKGLRGFLDEIVLDQEREEDKQEDIEKKRGVTLITMHAAKGLEFRHVYLIGLEEGVLPHDRSKAEGTIDEERRLLYVGITRARQTLTLTHCRDRMKFGSASACYPSSFIKELAPELLERIDLKKLLEYAGRAEHRQEPLRANAGGARRMSVTAGQVSLSLTVQEIGPQLLVALFANPLHPAQIVRALERSRRHDPAHEDLAHPG